MQIENPKKNFPKAMIIATIFIALSYILVSVAIQLIASAELLEKAGIKDAGYIVYDIIANNFGLNGKIVVLIYEYLVFRKNNKNLSFKFFKSDIVAYTLAYIALILTCVGFLGYVVGSSGIEGVMLVLKTYAGPIILTLVGLMIKNASQKSYKNKLKVLIKKLAYTIWTNFFTEYLFIIDCIIMKSRYIISKGLYYYIKYI